MCRHIHISELVSKHVKIVTHIGQQTNGKWFFPDASATGVGAGGTSGSLQPTLISRHLFVRDHSALTELLKKEPEIFSNLGHKPGHWSEQSLITVYKS